MLNTGMANQMKCWECRRRRRVCDKTSPSCQQCERDRITCSGYGNKPVTFLPIGMRSRQKREPQEKVLDLRQPMDRPASQNSSMVRASIPRDLLRQQDVYFVNAANFLNDHRKTLFSSTIYDNHSYFEDIPSSSPALPLSVWHSVTAIALLFHGNVSESCFTDKTVLRSRLLNEKQLAIRNLVDEISIEKDNPTYFTISSIYCLAQTDIMCAQEPQWRQHMDALTLIHRRRLQSNPKGVIYPHMRQSIMIWLLTTITIDTTSPASSQIFSKTHLQYWRLMDSHYSDKIPPFPPFPCPHPLLSCLVRINLIRAQSNTTPLTNIDESFTTLIEELDGFSGEDWIQSLGAVTDLDSWLRLAEVFQLALLVYTCAVLSPFSTRAVIWRGFHCESLLKSLIGKISEFGSETLECIAVLWPVVVAGFAAQTGPRRYRDSVRVRLLLIAGQLGYQGPINAMSTLEMFWERTDCETWDECFDRSQAFIA